jgi:molybdate transport system substrate-binding protein
MHLDLLSAGAAQGLVNALAARFATQTGCQIAGTFGAVGAMRDQLLAGAPADLLILTQALITGLAGTGHIVPGSVADIGVVRTALAVRCGDALPAVADRDGLRAALVAADGIYFPDPRHATAGMHFAKVLRAWHGGGAALARLREWRDRDARDGGGGTRRPCDWLHPGDGDRGNARRYPGRVIAGRI